MQLNKLLDSFELKLWQLASKFERVEQEKKALETENAKLKRELDRQRGTISSLKEKLAHTAANSSSMEPSVAPLEMNDSVRHQIATCIQELDSCIEWLEKH